MIITINGPAGSGKSSTAQALAEQLRIRHLDSGAFYRALTLAALLARIAPDQWDVLREDQLESLRVRGEPGAAGAAGYRMFAGDDDVTDRIRSPEVNAYVSRMARVPAVRRWLLGRLRAAGTSGSLVADGRDMGTVVFPQADLKIFLTASLETRARRRLLERGEAEPDADMLAAETERLADRDRIDSERAVSPLRAATDAVHLDTSGMSFDEQVSRVLELVGDRLGDA